MAFAADGTGRHHIFSSAIIIRRVSRLCVAFVDVSFIDWPLSLSLSIRGGWRKEEGRFLSWLLNIIIIVVVFSLHSLLSSSTRRARAF